jgi:hypothetical protein
MSENGISGSVYTGKVKRKELSTIFPVKMCVFTETEVLPLTAARDFSAVIKTELFTHNIMKRSVITETESFMTRITSLSAHIAATTRAARRDVLA